MEGAEQADQTPKVLGAQLLPSVGRAQPELSDSTAVT